MILTTPFYDMNQKILTKKKKKKLSLKFQLIPILPPLFLKHCGIGHLKTRLLPDLKLLQNVPNQSLFKLCKFHEKINGHFFARGQNLLYNAQVLRL